MLFPHLKINAFSIFKSKLFIDSLLKNKWVFIYVYIELNTFNWNGNNNFWLSCENIFILIQ